MSFLEALLCPYEDEILALWVKFALSIIWGLCIPNALLYGADSRYIKSLILILAILILNILITRKNRKNGLDVVTFWILSIFVFYICYNMYVGYLSILFMLIYCCGIVFILGIRYSIPINLISLALIIVGFRINEDSPVRVRYGDNIALRFPYLFICVVLIVYCLMYMIQRYWVNKNKRTQILEHRIADERKKLDSMSIRVLNVMVRALGAKIAGKEEHSRRVAEYAEKIAEAKGLSEQMCSAAYNAGLIHEIGMIGIPDELINKQNLTDAEYEVFKGYVEKGYQIVNMLQSEDMKNVAEAVRYHRENYDGTGFQSGLSGNNIPLIARILAVADYTDRHLMMNESRDTVINKLLSYADNKFDSEITDIMVKLLRQ